MRGKNAFTLAEVLITLAIIGVVAALTIPTLISNYQNKANVVKLQKIYNVLINGFNLMRADEGYDVYQNSNYMSYLLKNSFTDQSLKEANDLYITKYIKTSESCYDAASNSCQMNSINYSALNGSMSGTLSDMLGLNNPPYITTIDGVSVWILPYASMIWVDITGNSGPNIIGRDLFCFVFGDFETIDNNRRFIIYPIGPGWMGSSTLTEFTLEGFQNEPEYCGVPGSSDVSMSEGMGCAARIMFENWKITY